MTLIHLFEHRNLLRRQHAAYRVAQLMHRRRVERASGRVRLRKCGDHGLNALLLSRRQTERTEPPHEALIEFLSRRRDARGAPLRIALRVTLRILLSCRLRRRDLRVRETDCAGG